MRFRILLILFGGLLVAATFTFPLWRPLLVDDVVNDPFPGLPPQLQSGFAVLTQAEQAAFLQMAQEDPDMALEMVAAALEAPVIVNNPEDSDMPENAGTAIADGDFVRLDPIHWAQGTASIYQLPDERKILRFEDFQSANGPDLYVMLSASEAPITREEVELGNLHLELGPLKGNVGDQNYEIPAEVDLSLYNSVVIYCKAFHVVFSTATI